MMLRQVRPHNVDDLWPIVGPMLKPALAHYDDGTTLGTVRRRCKESKALLWLYYSEENSIQAALVLSLEGGWLNAWLVGGRDMEEWFDEVQAAMMRYCQEHGLKGLRAGARPGMAKRLRGAGWRTEIEIIRRPVSV